MNEMTNTGGYVSTMEVKSKERTPVDEGIKKGNDYGLIIVIILIIAVPLVWVIIKKLITQPPLPPPIRVDKAKVEKPIREYFDSYLEDRFLFYSREYKIRYNIQNDIENRTFNIESIGSIRDLDIDNSWNDKEKDYGVRVLSNLFNEEIADKTTKKLKINLVEGDYIIFLSSYYDIKARLLILKDIGSQIQEKYKESYEQSLNLQMDSLNRLIETVIEQQ